MAFILIRFIHNFVLLLFFCSDQFISKLSIIVAVNNMQTKQHAMKKEPHSYSNRNKIYKGLFFVVEGSLAENV